MKKVLLLLLMACCLSCSEEVTLTNAPYEVTVIGPDIDCGLWLIQFQDSDLPAIQRLTETNDASVFEAHNLEEAFRRRNTKLLVTPRKTRPDELGVCTTLGPSYPWITIVSAQVKNL